MASEREKEMMHLVGKGAVNWRSWLMVLEPHSHHHYGHLWCSPGFLALNLESSGEEARIWKLWCRSQLDFQGNSQHSLHHYNQQYEQYLHEKSSDHCGLSFGQASGDPWVVGFVEDAVQKKLFVGSCLNYLNKR